MSTFPVRHSVSKANELPAAPGIDLPADRVPCPIHEKIEFVNFDAQVRYLERLVLHYVADSVQKDDDAALHFQRTLPSLMCFRTI